LRKRADFLLQASALAPEFLHSLRIIPDFGFLELALKLGQTLQLGRVVKGTPLARESVPSGY
jgi:hypothetical protein